MGHTEYQGWLGNQNQKYSASEWFFAAGKKKNPKGFCLEMWSDFIST